MIDAANACKDASYNQDIEGTIFELTSNNQCLFTKKVSLLGTDEPILIQDLFSGKEMQCSYVKNNFNPELVTSLSQGLENCQGSLKDTIQLVIDSRK